MSLYTKLTRKDYLLHFIAGTLIFCFSVLFFEPITAMAITVVIGGLKEAVWDGWLRKGTVEVEDAVATFLGGLIPFIALMLQ